MMKRGFVVLIGVLVASLGLADVGQAQPPASVHVQGTLRAVDCNAQTVTLDTGGGSGVYRVAGAATFYINSAGTSLCALQQVAGAPATVWLTAVGSELLITRIDVAAQTYTPPPATAPAPYPAPTTYPPAPTTYTPAPTTYTPAPYPTSYPAPYPYPYPYPVPTPVPTYYGPPYYGPTYYGPPPLIGVVLGTIFLAGLVYLLVRHPSGALYRYPYYGPYYRHYYQPYYRPYFGPLIYAPAFRYGPYRWCPSYRAWGYWCR